MSSVLTPKQESFCLAYIERGNATEAYRRSYAAENMAEATVNREAKAMIDNPKVAARIAELRMPVVEKAQMTLETHLDDLKGLRNMAVRDRKWSAAIAAEVARGKAAGLYVERSEITGKNGGPIEHEAVVCEPDLSLLTDEELAVLERIHERLATGNS